MRKLIILPFLLLAILPLFSIEGYMFRIYLKDKGEIALQTDPLQLISERALQRRIKQGIPIDSTDYPVSAQYISRIESSGFKVIAKSKWLNTISVYCKDSLSINKAQRFNFVDDIRFIWKGDTVSARKSESTAKKIKIIEKPEGVYGYGTEQLKMLNGDYLHEQGYKGKGMEIAVIDAGYKNFPEIMLLDNIHVKGVKDFVFDTDSIFRSSDHGLKVLSVIGANRPDIYIGTAPEAKFWLLKSEDGRSEYPVEEDYWVAAAEYADSVGVDIINTSLGYNKFHLPAKSYIHDDLDGKTAFISKAARMAASKGIFMEMSAGNEGSSEWHKISVPADAFDVLTVGSVTRDSIVSSFSSWGPAADGRVKPEVMALGSSINVIGADGEVVQSSGTSFSGPVMSGIAACLWQAYPFLTNKQLLDVICRSGHKYDAPGDVYGYGIPDMKKAVAIAEELYGQN
ncbi:MAG TPA: serine protease [Dysgonomonas sp.]|nr:serine protease [Dysgonomonas sp.]